MANALKASRIVNSVVPRQVGKKTLVRGLLEAGEFLMLDGDVILNAQKPMRSVCLTMHANALAELYFFGIFSRRNP